VQTLPYIPLLFSWLAEDLCLGRLAYSGYLLELDKRLTEKAKAGFVFRMYSLCEVFDYVKLKCSHLPKVPVFACVATGIAIETLHIILPAGLRGGTISDLPLARVCLRKY